MNELIKIEETVISSEKVNTVNARELYSFLEVKSEFNHWIKDRLAAGRFALDKDYLIIAKKNDNSQKGRPPKEYYITLDAAKHIAMLERNDRGFEVRNYFIECEKKLRQTLSTEDALILGVIRADDIESRMLAMSDYRNTIVVPLQNKVQEQAVVIEEQTQVIEEAKPKVQFYDTVTMTTDTVDLADAAKLLNFQGVGRNTLYKLLRQWKVIDSDNRPYQKYVNVGCFKLVQYTIPGPYGNTRVKFKTVCYQKGLDLLLRMLIKKGYQKL